MGRHKKVDAEVLEKPAPKELDLTAYFEFAEKWHTGQTYGNDPYIRHLKDVVEVLKSWGFTNDEPTLIVGILHDILEDTKATKEDLLQVYNSYVVYNAVRLVTDPDGVNRAARKQALYAQYEDQSSTAMSVLIAARVKLADRFCNHRETINTNDRGKMEMYCKEFSEFLRVFTKYSGIEPWLKIAWRDLFGQYDTMMKQLSVKDF